MGAWNAVKAVGRWVYWALVAYGLLMLAIKIAVWAGKGSGPAKVGGAPVAAVAPVVAPVAADSGTTASCDCGSGVWCEGPRGGRYCLMPDGGKRYRSAAQ